MRVFSSYLLQAKRKMPMNKSRFSEQSALMLKSVDDGAGIDKMCRKSGASHQSFNLWRKTFFGLMP